MVKRHKAQLTTVWALTPQSECCKSHNLRKSNSSTQVQHNETCTKMYRCTEWLKYIHPGFYLGGGGRKQGMFPPKIIWQNNGNCTGTALFLNDTPDIYNIESESLSGRLIASLQ